MLAKRRFRQVDVFTSIALKGNPLAVVLDGDGLSDAQMHALARWTNLSETTFVLAPTSPLADYRVRIFSPGAEFDFAGHPTLGTAHALLEAGLKPKTPGRLIQECGVGLVPIDFLADGALAFHSPKAQLQALHAGLFPSLTATLNSAHICFDPAPVIATMGICWLVVRMNSAQACLDARVDAEGLAGFMREGMVGIAMYGPHVTGGPADYEVRAVFTKNGQLAEDPVTGSANACIARVLAAQDFPDGGATAQGYRARQGTLLGCDGRISVAYKDGAPWVGGHSVSVISGEITV
jgi:PhzF family phenazine biosynthesis protein